MQPGPAETQLEIRQLWGDTVLRLERFPLLGRVRVGGSRDCAFFAPASELPADHFPIVCAENGGPWLQLARGFEGEIEREGTARGFRELVASGEALPASDAGFHVWRIPLLPGMSVRLVIGPLVLLLRRVRPGDPIPVRLRDRLDYRFLGVLLG